MVTGMLCDSEAASSETLRLPTRALPCHGERLRGASEAPGHPPSTQSSHVKLLLDAELSGGSRGGSPAPSDCSLMRGPE